MNLRLLLRELKVWLEANGYFAGRMKRCLAALRVDVSEGQDTGVSHL